MPALNLILFDTAHSHKALMPLCLNKPVAALRFGIDTLAQKWENTLNTSVSYLVEPYLAGKYYCQYTALNYYINSSYVCSEQLAQVIAKLADNEAVFDGSVLLAYCSTQALKYGFEQEKLIINNKIIFENAVSIRQLSDLLVYNGKQLSSDFQRLTRGVSSEKVTDPFTVLYNIENIHIAKNVNIKAAVLDASNGPIFIDENATIEIGALIQGPTYIGKNSIVALGAKIRPNNSIGPYSKVGGEIGMSIIQGYSNKGHDGFMGCTYIGEWCNWGAATNNSNLKNNFGTVTLYNYATKQQADTDELFVGTIMADYSKTAIGTLLNTGTVVGLCCNVMAQGFPERHIPSFTWGGAVGSPTYLLPKALEVIEKTMARRQCRLEQPEIDILQHIFDNRTKL
jgi:UDP-N-acetylglucosamine diphosphorylase / glucose-1-phosphate thymidylyltransferase / UDP-N-acetylgalactosamine diphosphorylase / glucosamine-1-phosphate N-acetyltransferase / galactosamine-1-phosphate N-acetyltransferase